MRAQLTISPASLLAWLAQPAHSAAALAGPHRLPGTLVCSARATGGRQPESPWRSTAVFTCSGFTRFEPPHRTASTLLSFHPSTHSASRFPPPPLLAAHKQPETETERKKQVNLNSQHFTRSQCHAWSLISEQLGLRVLASSLSW